MPIRAVDGLISFTDRPGFIYKYSNMVPGLSGQTSIYGVEFFAFKPLLEIEKRQKQKFTILTRSLGAM